MNKLPENIFNYLPLKYSSIPESNYVSFWWNSYKKNIDIENYHLAFLSFHMLYMISVYFFLYKISKIYKPIYEHSLFHFGNDEENHYKEINSPFSFVNMSEKGVFRFLKIAGANNSFIGEVSRFIDDRNNAAHAKGLIYYNDDPEGLENKISDYIKALEKIQNLLIKESSKVSKTWKITRYSESDLKLFLENKIMINNLTPVELKLIYSQEIKKRPKLSKILNSFIDYE